jgi:hypothetical protein
LISTLSQIEDGWSNYLEALKPDGKLSVRVQRLAEERAAICKKCPELSESGFFTAFNQVVGLNPDGSQKIQKIIKKSADKKGDDWNKSFKCGECGCAFPANVFAEKKKCPIGKW